MTKTAREWRVDISHQQSYDVDEDTLLEEFGGEWDDAQKRGLDVEGFVRETVEIMRSYLDEAPELYKPIWQTYEVDITAPATGALPAAGSGGPTTGDALPAPPHRDTHE